MEMITPHGLVRMPAYMPVTTFGDAYPMDKLLQPYLNRLADCLMVSYFYARQMKVRPSLPLFVDSGGFAALLPAASIETRLDGTGVIRVTELGGDEDVITPEGVLALQENVADFGAPLDFPIPPECPVEEAQRRQAQTIANARWAIHNKTASSLRLFGCVQGWDVASYVACARELIAMGYTDLAIGGLVPRGHDHELVLSIVKAIKALDPFMLHVFGIGEPKLVRKLIQAGVTSVDSSSYVRSAADGKCWDGRPRLTDPSVFERVRIALKNLELGQACVQTYAPTAQSKIKQWKSLD